MNSTNPQLVDLSKIGSTGKVAKKLGLTRDRVQHVIKTRRIESLGEVTGHAVYDIETVRIAHEEMIAAREVA